MDFVSIDAETHYEMRILFGPMFGVDLLLPKQDAIFVCVGADDSSSRGMDGTRDIQDTNTSNTPTFASQYATNTLLVPHYKTGPNFRLSFNTGAIDSSSLASDQATRESGIGINVEWISGRDITSQDVVLNAVCCFEDVAFAIRHVGAQWSDAVRDFVMVAPALKDDTIEKGESPALAPRRKFRPVALACLITSVIALSSAVMSHFMADRAVANNVEATFDIPTAKNQIVAADGKVYVIATTENWAEWDKQIALKFNAGERPIVTSINALRKRAEHVLDQNRVDYFTIRFDRATEPELVLVSHPGEDDVAMKKRLDDATTALQRVLPFAKGLHIREETLADVARIASSSLTRIPVTFSRIVAGGDVTFFITGFITDYALSSVTDLVRTFSHDWGHRKIRFGLALKTTWLDGKSRQVGQDGYVLVDPSHWYFENMIKGNE
jgi:type III secretion system PrgH/EprH family protein